jgi:hypothetical protein
MAFKIFNFIKKNPVPDSKIDTGENITVWESKEGNNDFPQQLLQNVYNSPVASAAVELWQEFVEGDGFIEETTGDLRVNKKQDLNDLHALVSADFASMWGCSVHVGYNLVGERISFKHLPFEGARLGALNDNGITDKVYYNPYYGTPDFDKKFTKWFYAYNPSPEVVKAQIISHNQLVAEKKVDFPYPGQVYWFSIERPLARIYPQPFYYSAVSWFQVDASIQKFHSRNIDNNFLLSVLINKFGDPSTPAGDKDTDGNFTSTVGELFNKEMGDFAGADNAGSVLVNWYDREEEKADITAFPNNTNDTLFTTLQNLVSDQIAIGTKTPRVLLGIATAGKLGDTQEVLNAIKVMQGRTRRMRQALSRIYKTLFKDFRGVTQETDFTIKNINPFDILPDWVVGKLTTDQTDKYIAENFNIEFEEIVEEEVGEEKKAVTNDPVQAAAQAQLKGSVGGVQGILSIQQGVTDGLTTRESALEVLQLIYGFTLDESNRLLGQPKETEKTTTE